jgi:Rrf2 family protein
VKLTAQEEFGLRCLLQVGRQWPGGSLTIPEVSRREGMTVPHAAKTLQSLRQAGLVTSTRGQTGGYALAHPPGEIVVRDVLTALGGRVFEEHFCPTQIGAAGTCAHASGCSIQGLWRRVQVAMDEVLGSTTLADLLSGEHRAATQLCPLPAAPSTSSPNPTI